VGELVAIADAREAQFARAHRISGLRDRSWGPLWF
jgi:hypothetical protein